MDADPVISGGDVINASASLTASSRTTRVRSPPSTENDDALKLACVDLGSEVGRAFLQGIEKTAGVLIN